MSLNNLTFETYHDFPHISKRSHLQTIFALHIFHPLLCSRAALEIVTLKYPSPKKKKSFQNARPLDLQ